MTTHDHRSDRMTPADDPWSRPDWPGVTADPFATPWPRCCPCCGSQLDAHEPDVCVSCANCEATA